MKIQLFGNSEQLPQMAELFQSGRTNVVEHIKNNYSDGKPEEKATCREFRQVRMGEQERFSYSEIPNNCLGRENLPG
jgi:hypothetical protein